jgi:hypothetical protein
MPMGEKTKALWQDPEYRAKMVAAHKRNVHPCAFKKGHGLIGTLESEERRRRKIGESGKSRECYFVQHAAKDEAHPRWKGDEVGYEALHGWLHRTYGKADHCDNVNCYYPRLAVRGHLLRGPNGFDWANIDGLYSRELKHWAMLCLSCHRLLDRGNKAGFVQISNIRLQEHV